MPRKRRTPKARRAPLVYPLPTHVSDLTDAEIRRWLHRGPVLAGDAEADSHRAAVWPSWESWVAFYRSAAEAIVGRYPPYLRGRMACERLLSAWHAGEDVSAMRAVIEAERLADPRTRWWAGDGQMRTTR